MNNTKSIALCIVIFVLLFTAAIAGWRVDFFQISDSKGNIIFNAPSSVGHRFTTRYIHSVELSPVEDEYLILGKKLWVWEERVRSSNAGLPYMTPEKGRFVETDKWMIFQGGRMSWSEYYYRVGTDKLGLNQMIFEPYGRRDIYKIYSSEKLTIKVYRAPYLFKHVYFAEKLKNAPEGVPAIESFQR